MIARPHWSGDIVLVEYREMTDRTQHAVMAGGEGVKKTENKIRGVLAHR